jgi:signal peptidase
MKKLLYGALIVIALALVSLSIRSVIAGAPVLSYVYSESMEPVIMVNDGFIVLPIREPKIGDIVLYRPQKLEAQLITHRIIALGETGFITKGDNSPIADQEAGEPEVGKEQIVGKVLLIGGKPLLFKGYGKLVGDIQGKLGSYIRVFAAGLVTIGLGLAVFSQRANKRRRKSRYHPRMRDLYRIATGFMIVLSVMGMLIGSKPYKLDYLISTNPGTAGNHVAVGIAGQLDISVNNKGLLPVWVICSGIAPLSAEGATQWIAPLSDRSVQVELAPQYKTGWFRGYVRVYIYPMVMPRFMITFLHRQSPILGFFGITITLYLWLRLIRWIFEHAFKLEGWIPLKAFKDKTSVRRIGRLSKSLFGRIRAR